MSKFHKFFSVLVLGFTASLAGANCANALTANLSWTGNGIVDSSQTYSLIGTFTGNDGNSDGFIRSSDNEITAFNIGFFRDPSTLLAGYSFNQITTDPVFSFNYRIGTNTILQSGAQGSPLTSLSIGDSANAYSLDSFSGSGLSFNDFASGIDDASGGTLTATLTAAPVPFEFNPAIGLLALGALWMGDRLKKHSRAN
jgi:hypothetical protein